MPPTLAALCVLASTSLPAPPRVPAAVVAAERPHPVETREDASSPFSSLARFPVPAGVADDQVVLADGNPSWIVTLRRWPTPNDPAGTTEAVRLVDAVLDATIGRGKAHRRYAHALVGFAAGLSVAEAAALAADPRVLAVEPDMRREPARAAGGDPIGENPNLPVPWNLRRISAPDGLAPSFDPCGATGAGVTAVVIDSGIEPTHAEFTGRIVAMRNFALSGNPDASDNAGHGTHVAGTFAGATVGVASGADIVSLSVEEASGVIYSSSWIAAIDWVLTPGNVARPAVVNMSLGERVIAPSISQELVLALALGSGVPIVAAAGNDSHPADWNAPGSLRFAITVGATDLADRPSAFSNHGRLIDVWAPGSGIVSADWMRPDGGLATSSGTSMAAPAVAGAVALFLERHVTAEDLALRPTSIPGRAAIWLARNAAQGVLRDNSDARVASPGGNGALAGASNRLLQVCTTATGAPCDEPIGWIGETASIVLGDGIAPLDAGFTCERIVRHPDGPVSLTVNWASIATTSAPLPLARVTIEDAATGQPVWSSDQLFGFDSYEQLVRGSYRTVVSSTTAGLRVRWEPLVAEGIAGYGYTMTAQRFGACPGDLDGSGEVGAADLAILFDGWGPCAGGMPCIADLDLDGTVDSTDAALLLGSWGACADFVPEPYVRNCAGGFIHKSLIGDGRPDYNSRSLVLNPILAPWDATVIDAACPEAGLDVAVGNPVSPGFDEAQGACVLQQGGCALGSSIECYNARALFVSRGSGCDEIGPTLAADAIPCDATPISTGCPVSWAGWYTSPVYSTLTGQGNDFTHSRARWRQALPEGVRSITELSFPASLGASAKSVANGPGDRSPIPYPVAVKSVEFEVIVEFRDGGAPLLVRRTAVANPLISAVEPTLFGNYLVFTIDDIVADTGREIRSIEISCFRDHPLATSSLVSCSFAGRAAGAGEPLAEFSPDGGRTWIDEDALQLTMWIRP